MKSGAILEALILPLALLAAGLVLLQTHAIPYWQARAGTNLGVLWSLALEAAALTLLYQPGRWARLAGGAVAVVIVAVPLYQVARPAVTDWEAAHQARRVAAAERRAAVADLSDQERTIARLEASLATYRENSETRLGWEPMIAETEARLAEAEAKRSDLNAAAEAPLPPGFPWWRWAVEALPALLSLTLFQAMNVWAVRRVSVFRFGRKPALQQALSPAAPPLPEPPPQRRAATSEALRPPPPPETQRPPATPLRTAVPSETAAGSGDELTVRRLQREIAARIEASGKSARQWSLDNQVQPKDVSLLGSHFQRLRDGRETISAPKLAALAERFLEAQPAESGATHA